MPQGERTPASMLRSLAPRVGGRGGTAPLAPATDASPMTEPQYLMAQAVLQEIARYALTLAEPIEIDRFMAETDVRLEQAHGFWPRLRLADDYKLAEALRPYIDAVRAHVS